MDDKHINKKIIALNVFIKKLLENRSVDYDTIHDLRIKSREVISLISKKSALYTRVKKIIKLSNSIRDLDVFKYDFLESLHQHYTKALKLKTLNEAISAQRESELTVLLLYLEEFIGLEQDIQLTTHETPKPVKKPSLVFEKKHLHKYRIYVKTKLYIFKNRYPYEKAAIRRCNFLKDALGDINDNFNALNIIQSFEIDTDSLTLIHKYVESENKKLFKLIKKIA